MAGMALSALLTNLAAAAAATQTAPADQINHTFWYVSRAAGLCAYVMLCVNVGLGLALSTPLLDRFVMKWRIFDLHQFTGLLLVALLALHVFVLLGDTYIGFTVPQLLVPLLSPYRTWPVALGILAFYLTLVVTFSFYVRPRIGQRAWRLIHYGSFAVFALALLHGVLAGTDTGTVWASLVYALGALVVGGLTWWRFRLAESKAPGGPAARRRRLSTARA
jgi:predicted ferric reductase